MPAFSADICPTTKSPRLRFHFDNGWTASIVLNMTADPCEALCASLMAWPADLSPRDGVPGPQEASATEAVRWLATAARWPTP